MALLVGKVRGWGYPVKRRHDNGETQGREGGEGAKKRNGLTGRRRGGEAQRTALATAIGLPLSRSHGQG